MNNHRSFACCRAQYDPQIRSYIEYVIPTYYIIKVLDTVVLRKNLIDPITLADFYTI